MNRMMHCQDWKDEAISFVAGCLTREKQPRDDYREMLELTLIFLGEVPPTGIRFRKPGAYHHARWMAKIIYCFKIYLFRGQFKLTSRETKQLLEFNLFVALLYTKQWYTTSSSVAAPANDLSFLKKLEAYKSYADDISTTAAKALKTFHQK